MRVLCAGDLHIGRRSSKMPAELDGPEHSGAGAWEAIVNHAIDQRVDLVALSGDLVDRANRYFEALGPLERGLRRLNQAGIETYAVSGNHDFDVLPRLVDALQVDGFHLLGRGGRWERVIASGRDGRALHIDGWSFPQEYVADNPLQEYSGSAHGLPVLGLLHADLDQPGSPYGPVSLAELRRQPVALWLLGHIHAPREERGGSGPVVLYPGTPQALDPGESGCHGAWLAEIEPGTTELRRLPVSTVQYHPLTLDLSRLETPEALQQQLVDAVRDVLRQVRNRPESSSLQCLCCRLTLTGRTRLHRQLHGLIDQHLPDLELSLGDLTAVVEDVVYDTRPALDLTKLAGRKDPSGEVVRLIQGLEQPKVPTEYRALVTSAVQRLAAIHEANAFVDISTDPAPDAAAARALILGEAWSLLDTLVAQKEEA